MATLSQDVLDNAANAALDFHMDRGKVHYQHIQDKPLLRELQSRQKTFPGGKGAVTMDPVFETQSSLEAFEGDDTLTFTNPTPIKQASYDWGMAHVGIKVTTEELLIDGISVSDTNGKNVSEHSQRDMTALANILQVKLDDMSEGYAAGLNSTLWSDGTGTDDIFPGISAFISDAPETGTVGGINRATTGNEPWRNLAFTKSTAGGRTANAIAAADLITSLRSQKRQLFRYGSPKHIILCGSDFLDALAGQVDDNGQYSVSGFADGVDIGMGDISLRGVGTFMYDPSLDSNTKSDYAYFIDTNAIKLMPIEGEDMKRHYPARPHDKMVIYRSLTWSGTLASRQMNTSMVVQLA